MIATAGADVEALNARSAGAGRARRGVVDGRGERLAGDPRRADGDRARCSPTTWRPRWRSPRRWRPSTCSWRAPTAEALAPRVRSAGCLFVGNASGTAFGDYVAGSNHTLPDRGRRALRLRPQRAPLPAPDGGGPRGRRGSRAGRRRRCRSRTPKCFPAHAASMAPASESSPVTRTASIDRKTGETDVSLTLGLSGTGAGARQTGVGFFDHMLDLLARHGRLDLDGQRHRRPRRPARTTRSRTPGSCSGRRSTRRSATAAGSTATATPSCRWTRRARCARSTSPAGRTRWSPASSGCRRGRSTASTTSRPRSSSAPWPAPRG